MGFARREGRGPTLLEKINRPFPVRIPSLMFFQVPLQPRDATAQDRDERQTLTRVVRVAVNGHSGAVRLARIRFVPEVRNSALQGCLRSRLAFVSNSDCWLCGTSRKVCLKKVNLL